MKKEVVNRKDFQQWCENQEKLFILDLRDEEKYQTGSLHAGGLVPVNVPYIHMKQQAQPLPAKVAETCADTTIITVCTTGNKAQKAAFLLRQKGYRAVALEGGLTAWNSTEKQPE